MSGERYDLKIMEENLTKNSLALQKLEKEFSLKDQLGLPKINWDIPSLIDTVGNLHALMRIKVDNQFQSENITEKEFQEMIPQILESARQSYKNIDTQINKIINSFPENIRDEIKEITGEIKNNLQATIEEFPNLYKTPQKTSFDDWINRAQAGHYSELSVNLTINSQARKEFRENLQKIIETKDSQLISSAFSKLSDNDFKNLAEHYAQKRQYPLATALMDAKPELFKPKNDNTAIKHTASSTADKPQELYQDIVSMLKNILPPGSIIAETTNSNKNEILISMKMKDLQEAIKFASSPLGLLLEKHQPIDAQGQIGAFRLSENLSDLRESLINMQQKIVAKTSTAEPKNTLPSSRNDVPQLTEKIHKFKIELEQKMTELSFPEAYRLSVQKQLDQLQIPSVNPNPDQIFKLNEDIAKIRAAYDACENCVLRVYQGKMTTEKILSGSAPEEKRLQRAKLEEAGLVALSEAVRNNSESSLYEKLLEYREIKCNVDRLCNLTNTGDPSNQSTNYKKWVQQLQRCERLELHLSGKCNEMGKEIDKKLDPLIKKLDAKLEEIKQERLNTTKESEEHKNRSNNMEKGIKFLLEELKTAKHVTTSTNHYDTKKLMKILNTASMDSDITIERKSKDRSKGNNTIYRNILESIQQIDSVINSRKPEIMQPEKKVDNDERVSQEARENFRRRI